MQADKFEQSLRALAALFSGVREDISRRALGQLKSEETDLVLYGLMQFRGDLRKGEEAPQKPECAEDLVRALRGELRLAELSAELKLRASTAWAGIPSVYRAVTFLSGLSEERCRALFSNFTPSVKSQLDRRWRDPRALDQIEKHPLRREFQRLGEAELAVGWAADGESLNQSSAGELACRVEDVWFPRG